VVASLKVLNTGHGTIVYGKWIGLQLENIDIATSQSQANIQISNIPKPNARFWLLHNALLPASV